MRESVNHLHDVGCRSLKTNPVSNIGEWLKNGFGESIPKEELFRLYLDYIPQYYEDGMPLSLLLGGFFSASPDKPDQWDIPLYHYPSNPEKCCVCSHARKVMYISPEGRTLPCMSLSGMKIQDEFPLIPEKGLSSCLTDSFYMDFIDTRADKVLKHNPECVNCIWNRWCLGGCRACGLESSGESDLMYKDPMSCHMFINGWVGRLTEMMLRIRPDSESPVTKDIELMELLGIGSDMKGSET